MILTERRPAEQLRIAKDIELFKKENESLEKYLNETELKRFESLLSKYKSLIKPNTLPN